MRTLSPQALAGAASLSALAGFVDGIAFLYLGGYFVSFMSGNTTQGSVELVRGGSWPTAFLLVVAFVAGVVLGTVVGRVRRRRGAAILASVAAALAIGAALTEAPLPAAVPAAFLAIGMGAVNTLFARDGRTAIGLTYMTGALVKVGEGIVAAATGGSRTEWLRSLALWVAIAAGAVLGALAYSAIGMRSLWLAVAMSAALAVVLLLREGRVGSRGTVRA